MTPSLLVVLVTKIRFENLIVGSCISIMMYQNLNQHYYVSKFAQSSQRDLCDGHLHFSFTENVNQISFIFHWDLFVMLILILLSNIGRGNMWSPHSPNTNQIYSLSTSIKQICTHIQIYKYINIFINMYLIPYQIYSLATSGR